MSFSDADRPELAILKLSVDARRRVEHPPQEEAALSAPSVLLEREQREEVPLSRYADFGPMAITSHRTTSAHQHQIIAGHFPTSGPMEQIGLMPLKRLITRDFHELLMQSLSRLELLKEEIDAYH